MKEKAIEKRFLEKEDMQLITKAGLARGKIAKWLDKPHIRIINFQLGCF